MAARLGKVIYWASCIAAIVALLIGGYATSYNSKAWVSSLGKPSPVTDVKLLAQLELGDRIAQWKTFEIQAPSGERFEIAGPNQTAVLAALGRAAAISNATERMVRDQNSSRERTQIILGIAAVFAVGVFLFGRAVRYVLAGA
jgi:hypothetical protein